MELDAVGIVAVMPTEPVRSHDEHAVNEAGDICKEPIRVQEADVVVKLPVATVPVVSARSLDLRTVGRKTRGGPLNISSQKGGNQPGLNYS